MTIEEKTPPKSQRGIPLITAKIVKAGRIETPSEFIAPELYNDWMVRGLPQIGDIVMTTEAPLGEVAQIDDANVALAQRIVTLRGKSGLLHNNFLLYLMQSDYFQHQLESRATGTTVRGIKQSELRKVTIPLPPIEEQVTIGQHLKSLDDKIELNRRMNQTLEAMAQAIFQSWFVDFDPVKAKLAALATGRDPERAAMAALAGKLAVPKDIDELSEEDLAASEAALFPAVLVESALGLIPAGWEVKYFGDVADCFDSKRVPLSKREREKRQGPFPYHGATGVMDSIDDYLFDDILLLLGEDGSVTRPDGTPFTQYVWGKIWVNNHAHVLKGKKSISTEQLYLMIKNQNITAFVTGAVQLKLNQKNMNSIQVIRAENAIHVQFQERCDSLFQLLRRNTEQINTLSQLRNILLPKLLSGELSVPAAEAMAG